MARCAYLYKDGAQCIIRAPYGKKMCEDHRLLVQMAKDKAKHNAKNYKRYDENRKAKRAKKPKVEKIKAEPEKKIFHDHTAPWSCALENCGKCKNKPTYIEYMRARFEREVG